MSRAAAEPPPQTAMIDRVRRLCVADDRIEAALQYGSFAKGEGDSYSDIEFYIYLAPAALAGFDPAAWLAQIAPVLAFFLNEFGSQVAIFANLVRGEFHFEPIDHVDQIAGWSSVERGPGVEAMRVVDRDGRLTAHLSALGRAMPDRTSPAAIGAVADRLLNWWLLGMNVLRRGEAARALDALGHAQRHILWLARAAEGAFDHWPTPSRALERDLSPAAYARFVDCTAGLDRSALARAYGELWEWSGVLEARLAEQHEHRPRAALRATINAQLPAWLPPESP